MATSTSSLLSIFFCSAKRILFFSPKHTVMFSTSLPHTECSYLLMLRVEYCPKGTFVPSSAACLSHCSTLCSSKWVRNLLSFVSSCEPKPYFMLLELPSALKLAFVVLPCCSLPPLCGRVAPHLPARSFSPGQLYCTVTIWVDGAGSPPISHSSGTSPIPPARGFEEGVKMKARQLLRWECVVAGKGVVPRQGVWRRQCCKGKDWESKTSGWPGKALTKHSVHSWMDWFLLDWSVRKRGRNIREYRRTGRIKI